VQRDGRLVRLTLRPGPYPIEMPKLPGPPKVGSVAPPLKVDVVRGAKKLAAGKPRLLFFWATWCAICKSALPEVMAFSADRNVEVLAISDEPVETVQPFLDKFKEPFPNLVATDRRRITIQSYGVSGLPTFVYVDGNGVVRHYQSGYTRKLGLQIDGWKWEPEGKQADAGDAAPSVRAQP
jgi:thiol-disulfide isomerase/thioredoxin